MGLKDLAKRPTNAPAKSAGGVNPGRGHDVTSGEYGQPVVSFDDLPTKFAPNSSDNTAANSAPSNSGATGGKSVARRDSAGGALQKPTGAPSPHAAGTSSGPPIAQSARTLQKPRRSGGKVVERRVAWKATSRAIVYVTAEQELTRDAGGKFRRSGQWWLTRQQTFTPASAPVRKPGRVPVDAASTGNPTGGAGAGSNSANPDTYEAELALASLPAPVRASVLARVPTPSVSEGAVVKYDGSVERYEVNLLRMDAVTAAVVTASRGASDSHWDVTYLVFNDLTEAVRDA